MAQSDTQEEFGAQTCKDAADKVSVSCRPIGIFDSGLGGLTVARSLVERLPAESLYYVGDTKRCPYGPRPQSEVRLFVRQVGHWLENHDVKLVVIACNTATAAGLDILQRTLRVPVIGVIEPGARAAIQATHTRRVGVLATTGTVSSGAYVRAIHNLDAGVQITQASAGSFVDYIEHELASGAYMHEDWVANKKVFDTSDVRELARTNVAPLRGKQIDTVVLGCTHFPLLEYEIAEALGPGVQIVSSAEETAREVEEILERRDALVRPDQVDVGAGGEPKYHFATTSDDITSFALAGKFIFGHAIDSVEHIELDTLDVLTAPTDE